MKKRIGLFFICLLTASVLCAADLSIGMNDVRLVRSGDGGYDLYIRKKDGMRSVLLTETTKDPQGREDNYAFRDKDWNPVNGDELRLLDGGFLSPDRALFSLIDSTSEPDPVFGEAFRIYIPRTIYYGYPWSRNGTVELHKGMFVNLRAFEKPYADYGGAFKDNPFVIDLIPPRKDTAMPVFMDDFRPETVVSFTAIAEAGNGVTLYSRGLNEITDKIRDLLTPPDPEKNLDLVFAIDATQSMDNDIRAIRETLPAMLKELLPGYKSYRLGLVLYKDYDDDFMYQKLPVKVFSFTDNVDAFMKQLNGFHASGGRDIPEAVYEALYASMEFFRWRPDAEKKVILIGDAEPHPEPRGTGTYSKAYIESIIKEKGIEVDTIILMDENRPNR